LTGDNALKAKVGESVRLFIGNGGPNMISSFHVIGEIFDKVYMEGGKNYQENVQTTLIPSGGSSIIEFGLDVPGTFLLVDHSIFRTFHKGTVGMLKVEGEAQPMIFKSDAKPVEEGAEAPKKEEVKKEEPKKAEVAPVTEKKAEVVKVNAPAAKISGKEVFLANCSACHGEEGLGVEGSIPPLAKSDFLKKLSSQKDRTELIHIPLHGRSGKITVNGKVYEGEMPPFAEVISDREVAEVLTYVSNSWGNKAKKFTEAEVKKARDVKVANNNSK